MSKGYIKIIFSLLISSVYLSNKALAADANSSIEALRRFARLYNTRSSFPNDYSEGTSEQSSFDLYMNPEENKETEKLMNESEILLQHHATSTNGYKLYNIHKDSTEYYMKHGNTIMYKFNHKIKYLDKYNGIIDMLWNPNVKYFGNQIVSDDTTIIVYTSSDIDEYNSFDKRKYTNTIVESANLSKSRIYS
ncbi:hypothetical protein YYC_02345 [Plasmodium yoelii 17X]|uniref:Fam-a protein n=2 Tax=Plasmodium yoelii TaxID=5861 RepID=Q7R877_PLAYO|nr:hypothetical protein [Plasmodium yoelii yoelii]ETB60736.1 hypothetical protein YYC_02345 [Plasmodium yoelii 17X]